MTRQDNDYHMEGIIASKGTTGLVRNKCVVRMAEPLNNDLARRAKVSRLDKNNSGAFFAHIQLNPLVLRLLQKMRQFFFNLIEE